MTDSSVLQRAKEGNADAIAALMNQSLTSKGIHATVERAGNRLLVTLDSSSVPDQAMFTKFVNQGVQSLKLATVKAITISGRVRGSDRPAWTSTSYLDAQPDQPPSTNESTQAIVPPPPPPPPPPPRAFTQEPVLEEDIGQADEDVVRTMDDESSVVLDAPETASAAAEGITTALQLDEVDDNIAIAGVSDSENEPSAEDNQSLDDALPASSLDPGALDNELFDDVPIDDVAASYPLESDEGLSDAAAEGSHETSFEYDVYAGDQSPDEEGGLNEEEELNELPSSADTLSPDEESLASADASEKQFELPPPPPSQREKSGSPFLLISIMLVMFGAVGSLIGYSLWSYFSSGGSILDPGLTTSPALNQPGGADVPDSEPTEPESTADGEASTPPIVAEDVLLEADEKAVSARTLSQTAQSGDDWDLIVRQWQRAIALAEQIPETDEQYNTAQQRLASYRNSLAAAQQQASTLANVGASPLPSTVITLNDDPVECVDVVASPDSQAIELTNVQFEDIEDTGAVSQIVGCITNHGDQVISSVTVDYIGTPLDNPDSPIEGRGGLQFSDLAPGSTVAFRGNGIAVNLSTIEINTITWLSEGVPEPQSAALSLAITNN